MDSPNPDDLSASDWSRWLKHSISRSAGEEYVTEYMKGIRRTPWKSKAGYFNKELVPKRRTLVYWMRDIVSEFNMEDSIYFYAVRLLDRVCCLGHVPLGEFQQTGLTCVWIIDKFLSVSPVDVDKLKLVIADEIGFSLVQREMDLLSILNYEVTDSVTFRFFPVPSRDLFCSEMAFDLSFEFQQFCKYFCLCALEDYELAVLHPPELVARAVYIVASHFHFEERYACAANNLPALVQRLLQCERFTYASVCDHSFLFVSNVTTFNMFYIKFHLKYNKLQ